ncbi:hypothetical protein EYC80_007425 [Monilinia laxa]|uniref:FAD dependent oxidoreductase domain-containing protein n=1 Tax=Monilinia laxa TaxID=61186 RepID=A0A5N6JVM4_MONLA|nr:hypothetical protein EYC80_007425 [Monilinia laxa]
MTSHEFSHSSPIKIIGAGVFGLSTGLYLSKAGYTDITIFDYQPYHENEYSTTNGADAASADFNKVMRMSYGSDIMYQRLAMEGVKIWNEWNEQLSKTPNSELPKGLSSDDKLWENCGFLRLSEDDVLSDHELTTLVSLTNEGLRDTQYILGNVEDENRARDSFRRFDQKFDALKRKEKGQALRGVFDSTAGFLRASKACLWAMHLARKSGVKFVIGENGRLASLIKESDGKVVGVKTADGVSHRAELVIIAAGSWTPSLLPSVRRILEATAGSVAYIQIPKSRQDLWTRFAPENFPVFSFGGWGSGAGLGGFPRTETGIIKIGFRGKKYTNYDQLPSDDRKYMEPVSVPKTRYSPEVETRITKEALNIIKGFIASNLPELVPFGISGVRNCWYTDSLDNDFLISRVPTQDGLMVCSGGSGHGFKFLPILGREVVRIIESRRFNDLNEYGQRWQWRDKKVGDARNGLEDGVNGPRVWSKMELISDDDLQFNVDYDEQSTL